MRISTMVATFVLATGFLVPGQAPEAGDVGLALVQAPGPPVILWTYSPSVHGDWQTSYPQWTPTMIYYHRGQYYRNPVPGSRAVSVYTRNGDFFLPPRDRGWVGKDKRYDRGHGPSWRDRGRAKNHDEKHSNNGRGRP